MKKELFDEDLMKRYLLGDLSSDALQQLEERFLTDDEFFASYSGLEDAVEDELVDRYVDGELTPGEREQFEHIFLSTPERVQKLRIAQVLHEYVNSPAQPSVASALEQSAGVEEGVERHTERPRRRFWLPFVSPQNALPALSMVLALVLVSMAALAFLFRTRRLEGELREARARQTQAQPSPLPEDNRALEELSRLRARNEELTADLRRVEAQRALTEQKLASLESSARTPARVKERGIPANVLSLVLPLVRSRGSGAQGARSLELPDKATAVRLYLELDTVDPSDYRSFQAVIETDDGKQVLTTPDDLKVTRAGGAARVSVIVPAQRLSDGDYLVRLSGVNGGRRSPIGVYDFRINRK